MTCGDILCSAASVLLWYVTVTIFVSVVQTQIEVMLIYICKISHFPFQYNVAFMNI